METLSLYSGAGGLDLGASLAGANIRLATDYWRAATMTLERATGVATLTGDLATTIRKRKLRAALNYKSPELIIGGPPCTGFSHAGFWIDSKLQGDDPATDGVTIFARSIERFRPEAFIMENVPGLLFKTYRVQFERLLKRFDRLGYNVVYKVLSASDFGVAQSRRRLFLIGVRKTHGKPSFQPTPKSITRGAEWAFSDITNPASEPDEIPKGSYTQLLQEVPPGENYIYHTERGPTANPTFGYRKRYWSFLKKLHPKLPSTTLSAARITWNGPFHWENRHLRVPEMAALQGFPYNYPWPKDLTDARRQIGNAVPPPLAAYVTWSVRCSLEGTIQRPQCLLSMQDPKATAKDCHGEWTPPPETE